MLDTMEAQSLAQKSMSGWVGKALVCHASAGGALEGKLVWLGASQITIHTADGTTTRNLESLARCQLMN